MTSVTSLDDRQDPTAGPFEARNGAPRLGPGARPGHRTVLGGDPAAGLSLPGSDSQQAQALLEERFPQSRAIPWLWWCAPMRSPAPADTFLPARRRDADFGPASS